MARSDYPTHAERDAYDCGQADGCSGLAPRTVNVARTYPNAYHRGYWEGVYDREYRAQQGERDSV